MKAPFLDVTGRPIRAGDIVAYAVGTDTAALTLAVVADYVSKSPPGRYRTTDLIKIKLLSRGTKHISGVYDPSRQGRDRWENPIQDSYYARTVKTSYFEDYPNPAASRFVVLDGVPNPLDGWIVGEPV